jgi:outer membrane protein OmpA-like peptidoglycan-associated protein
VAPAAQTAPAAPPAPPPAAAQPKPASPPPPPAAQSAPQPPAAQSAPPAPAAQQQPATVQRAPRGDRPAAAPPPPPTQTRSSGDFIRRDNQGPQRGFDDIRRDRRETRDGNRTVINEGDRTIVRDGNRTIIRHNEADRFAIGARDVRVTQRNNDTISIIVRPDGAQIVTTTGRDGRLIRRVRRDRNGREVIIIDNRFAGARPGFFVNVPPPRYRGPRDRYILDARRANRDAIFALFLAPPIERIDRRYTLEEVRYSEPLRAYMPRVDLDVNFETGSWQLTPDQFDQLAVIAEGLNRAIAKNPREVFLIEGHTDAVGSDEDNLSLSDRRAEAVAVALTEQFQVPPENLVTQGYGEQNLKVPTDGPSAENRRVAVLRITPLMDQQAGR